MSRLSTFTTRALSAQFLKPTLVLLATFAVGGAWADYFWTAGGGTDTDWNKAANWSGTLDNTANYVFGGYESSNWVKGKDITVTFAGAYSAIPAAGIWVENIDSSGNGNLSWRADNDSHGLALTGNLTVGSGTPANFILSKGSYSVSGCGYVSAGSGAAYPTSFKVDGASLTINGSNSETIDNVDYSIGFYVLQGNNTHGTKVCVTNGTLAVANGDAVLSANGCWTSDYDNQTVTGYVTLDIDNGGVFSCGDTTTPYSLMMGRWGNEDITVNLNNGGVLKVGGITWKWSWGTKKINFNGGTIQALGNSNDFIANLDSPITVVIGANGGIIDTQGYAVTIAAPVTGSGTIIKKGAGTLTFTGNMSGFTGKIIVAEGGAVTVSEGAGATAGVGTTQEGLVFSSTAFAWTGAANDGGKWNTPGNWAIAGVAQTDNYPNSSSSVVSFPDDANVVISADLSIGRSIIPNNARVTLSGDKALQFVSFEGSGLLRLAGATLKSQETGGTRSTIATAVEIVEGTTNKLIYHGTDRTFLISGNMQGSGVLQSRASSPLYMYVTFSGDNRLFTGTYEEVNIGSGENNSQTQFTSYLAVSPSATYIFGAGTRSQAGFNFMLRGGGPGTTYSFGSLSGEVHFDGNNNTKGSQYYGYTLEVGGKNESCTLSGNLQRTGYASQFRKIGTAEFTYTGSQIGNIEIAGGTYIIGSNNAMPLANCYFSFSGGALSISQGIDVDPIPKFATDGSTTAAVIFDDWGYPHEWSGALTQERVPNGFTKKGSGTLTLTTSPTYTGKTTIEAGTLVIPSGTTLGELSISEGAHLFISGVDGDTVTVGSFSDGDTTKGRVIVVGDSAISFVYDENSGKYVGTISRADLTYTWNGSAGSAWDDINNWTVTKTEGGDVVSLSAVNVTEVDTVVFPEQGAPWSVVLSSDQTMASVAFNGQTSLSGGMLFSSSYTGTGKVILGDDAGLGNNEVAITIANPIEIAGTGVHTNKLYANGKNLTASGALSGSGNLNLVASVDSIGVLLTGDNKMTSGSIVVEPALANSARRNCSTIKPNSSNSNLVWKVSNGANNKHTGGNYSFLNGEGTYYFGSINNINQPAGLKNSIVEIGALVAAGETCAVGGVFYSVDSQVSGRLWNSQYTSTTLRKVGAGTISTSMQSIYNYDVVSGTLELAVDNARPAADGTIKFSGNGTLALNDAFTYDVSTNIAAVTASTPYPITVDTGTTPRTWEVAIPNNYTGGFTKKGTGTLTLSQAPKYKGTTTVEAGTLVIDRAFDTSDTAIAPGATLKVLTQSEPGTTPRVSVDGLYKVATETDGEYTVYTVVASAESIDVDGTNIVVDVDYLASVGITSGTTDKSAALKEPAANGLAVWQNYVMNINATQKFAAVVTPTTNESMTVATSFGAGRTDAGVTVSYKLMKKKSGDTWEQVGEASATPSFSVNPSTLDANARLKIQAVFKKSNEQE